MGVQHGSKECILPNTNPSGLKEVPEAEILIQSLTVQDQHGTLPQGRIVPVPASR